MNSKVPESIWLDEQTAEALAQVKSEGDIEYTRVSPAVPLDAALCRMNELRMEDGYSSHYQGGYEMFRTQAIAVIKSLMAQSPAASGAQTCQDADDALVSPDYEKGFEDGCAFTVATLEDNLGHLNYIFDGMDCCKRCKLVRPAEGWTRPCKGSHELSLRAATAPTTPLCIDCHHNNLVGQYCAEIVQRGDVQRACGCRCVFGAPPAEVPPDSVVLVDREAAARIAEFCTCGSGPEFRSMNMRYHAVSCSVHTATMIRALPPYAAALSSTPTATTSSISAAIAEVQRLRNECLMASHNSSDGWERRELMGRQVAFEKVLTVLAALRALQPSMPTTSAAEPVCTCFADEKQMEHATYCPREGMDYDQ